MEILNQYNKNKVSTTSLTEDQQNAYFELIDFIKSDYNPNDYKRALIGPAGTGKTYLVKALIRNCGLSYSMIGVTAPTHKACRVLGDSIKIPNVKINTIQSNLGLRPNFDVENFDINNVPFDSKGKIKINDYKLFIIDEASMLNRGLVMFLERICKSNKCKILYIGDSSQLPPPKENKSSAFSSIEDNKKYILKTLVRQDKTNPIVPLLNLLREDIKHKTFKFIEYLIKNPINFDEDNVQGYQVCDSNTFNNLIYTNFNDEQLTKNVDFVKIIAYTNKAVTSWNNIIRNAIILDADKSILTKNDLLISYKSIVDKFNDLVIKNSEEYIIHDIVNYTHPTYDLQGFLVKFTAIYGGSVTTPLFVVNHKDNFTLNKYIQIITTLINNAKTANAKHRSQYWKEYYTFKESCLLLTNILDNNGKLLYSRDIDYGFALTAHKSQGSTFDTVFVDVHDIMYDIYGHLYPNAEEINRRLYVACSRCKNKLYLKL